MLLKIAFLVLSTCAVQSFSIGYGRVHFMTYPPHHGSPAWEGGLACSVTAAMPCSTNSTAWRMHCACSLKPASFLTRSACSACVHHSPHCVVPWQSMVSAPQQDASQLLAQIGEPVTQHSDTLRAICNSRVGGSETPCATSTKHDCFAHQCCIQCTIREEHLCGSSPAQLLRCCLPYRPAAQPGHMQRIILFT